MAKRFGIEPKKNDEALGSEAPPAVEVAEENSGVPVVESPSPEPATAPVPQAPPDKPAAYVRLEVFCRLTGLKWDRTAGFKHWAKKRRLGPMTVSDWWVKLKEFQSKPVG